MKTKVSAGGAALLLLLGLLIISCGTDDPATIVQPETESDNVLAAPGNFPKVKLNVHFIPQVPPGSWSKTKNCGQASVLNAVGHLKRACMSWIYIIYENNWLARTYRDPRFSHPSGNGHPADVYQLANLARNYWGYGSSVGKTSNLTEVYNELRAGRPVVVGVRVNMSPRYNATRHFMLLVGMDNYNVWVNDVGKTSGKDNCFTLNQFYFSWITQNKSVVLIR